MESLLAVASLAAAGLTLMLLTLRPRSSPPWPPLHDHTGAHADDNRSSSDAADEEDEQIPACTNDPSLTLEECGGSKDHTSPTAPENGVKVQLLGGGRGEESSASSSTSPCRVRIKEACDGDSCGDSEAPGDSPAKAALCSTHDTADSCGDSSKSEVTTAFIASSAEGRGPRLPPSTRQRRVLFVIAHPDDECMFFGPSILHFTQKEKAMVFLICLTNGSYNSTKLGRVRQRELWASCEVLGIPAGHITLYRCRHLPDHPSKSWPVVTTANIINKHLHTLQCDMVVTFDGSGVSGHINHRSLHSSLCYLLEERLLPPECSAYRLDSVNVVRKYSSVLDIACSFFCSSHLITADTAQYCTIRTAMRAHASQYLWFRKLYMLFSRYVVINTLSLMKPCTKAPSNAW